MTSQATAPAYSESGPGSVAGIGGRFLAFVVDGLIADLLAILIDDGWHPGNRQSFIVYLGFLLIEVLFLTFAGQTPGMKLLGIVVVKHDTRQRQSLRWILMRTLLLAFVMPALIVDEDGRAMHDRGAGTVMLKTR